MSKVLIFSGTTEGRELAEILAKSGIECYVCVATEYGERVMEENELIHIERGRLDEEGMKKLYDSVGCQVIVDATHPYASLVTDTIKKSIASKDIEYLRLLRPDRGNGGSLIYADPDECAKALLDTKGNILLTTGSKELDLRGQTHLRIGRFGGTEVTNVMLAQVGLPADSVKLMMAVLSASLVRVCPSRTWSVAPLSSWMLLAVMRSSGVVQPRVTAVAALA